MPCEFLKERNPSAVVATAAPSSACRGQAAGTIAIYENWQNQSLPTCRPMVLNSLEREFNTKTYTYFVTFGALKAFSWLWLSRSAEVHNASLRFLREPSNISMLRTALRAAADAEH